MSSGVACGVVCFAVGTVSFLVTISTVHFGIVKSNSFSSALWPPFFYPFKQQQATRPRHRCYSTHTHTHTHTTTTTTTTSHVLNTKPPPSFSCTTCPSDHNQLHQHHHPKRIASPLLTMVPTTQDPSQQQKLHARMDSLTWQVLASGAAIKRNEKRYVQQQQASTRHDVSSKYETQNISSQRNHHLKVRVQHHSTLPVTHLFIHHPDPAAATAATLALALDLPTTTVVFGDAEMRAAIFVH